MGEGNSDGGNNYNGPRRKAHVAREAKNKAAAAAAAVIAKRNWEQERIFADAVATSTTSQ
jgi:hypothetical protein